MHARLTILFLSLLPVLTQGQVTPKTTTPKTTSKPPVPLSPPPVGNAGTAGTSGLRLSKIPVMGNYYLGMKNHEYDSINGLTALTVKTDKGTYPLKPDPLFYMKRLAQLRLSIDSSIFSSDLSDITAWYEAKLGIPDDKKQSDTLRQFPAAVDSSLNGEYRVKVTLVTWRFNHHDIFLSTWMADLGNGKWKGNYSIYYYGNSIFQNMIYEMAIREGDY